MANNLRFLAVGLFDNVINLEWLRVNTSLSEFSDKLGGFHCKSQGSAYLKFIVTTLGLRFIEQKLI